MRPSFGSKPAETSRAGSMAETPSHQETSDERRSTCSSESPKTLPTSRSADFAAVGDDLAHHGGPLATVLGVDGLNDLFAPFVLEVDVDVRRLAPFDGQEALKEQV